MKFYVALLAIFTSGVLNAAELTTNYLLSIHLVRDEVFPQWQPGTMPKPGKLKLVSPPVLADRDFVSFDFKDQTFVITPQAAKRLARDIWHLKMKDVLGDSPTILRNGAYDLVPTPAPFVLKASGEPIYVGPFYTLFSSSSFAGPVIIPESPFIHTNLNSNVTLKIQPGYPGEFPGIPKQLNDARIAAAVKKLSARKRR
jgi:hypothetical protein